MKRRSAGGGPSLSLFPFLAVLVCTMGSLIVLLVIVVQQARAQAESQQSQAEAQPAASRELDVRRRQQEAERDGYLWRMDVLQQARQEKLAELETGRLQLAHLEQHIRELEQRWKTLTAQARQLQAVQAQEADDAQQLQSQSEQMQQAIAAARQELADALSRAHKPQSFAIIPYQGSQATLRRPIYLECTSRGVELQPEGIILGAADFAGMLGPGNPLDALVRAVRTYWIENGVVQSDREPYPLLVVRPSGVVSYGLSRSALEHWDDTFGYELVSEDLPLAYPKRDPQLAAAVERAIRDARQRQLALARAMPRAFGDAARELMERSLNPGPGGNADIGDGLAGPGGRDGSASSGSSGDPGAPSGGAAADAADGAAASGSGAQGGAAGGSNAAAGGAQGGQGDSPLGSGGPPQPLAQSRGSNWATGNPGASGTATGWTRPIQIQLYPRSLIVPPEAAADGAPTEIVFDQGEINAADALARAVRQRYESWGQPPTGGFWKPVLQIHVAPGAEPRFQALDALLRHSGLQVERK